MGTKTMRLTIVRHERDGLEQIEDICEHDLDTTRHFKRDGRRLNAEGRRVINTFTSAYHGPNLTWRLTEMADRYWEERA